MPWKDHPAIVASVLSASLIAARLLIIARFDVSTAATILQITGVATAVAGTALTLLPFALVITTCTLALVVFVDKNLLPVTEASARTALAVFLAATLALTALPLAVATALIVMSVYVAGRYLQRHDIPVDLRHQLTSHPLLRRLFMILVVVLALTPIVLQRPWLPIQAVIFSNGRSEVGYVLGEAGGRLALMSDRDRTIRFIRPDSIADRYICSGAPATSGLATRAPQVELRGSLVGMLMWGDDTPRYPACPRLPTRQSGR